MCPANPPSPSSGRLAVSGASGRIGRRLRRIWAGADIAWHSRRDGPLAAALDGCGTLIALGGVTSGDATALTQNSAAALTALDAAHAAGVPRVLLFSSAAVYGPGDAALHETATPRPVSAYGAAKAAQEDAVAAWRAARPDGPEVVCLRLGNVAGADALLGNLGAARPRLDVFADGTAPRRSYIGPQTLARVLRDLSDHSGPLPSLLNVAAPGPVGMDDLLSAAGRAWDAVPAPDTAIPLVHLDTARLDRLVRGAPSDGDPQEMVRQWRATEAAA